MSPKFGTHYRFTSSIFQVEVGEDEETNPRMYGRQLANWLRDRFLSLGYPVEDVLPEDWGWCVMCQRDPYRLFIGCVNLRDFEYVDEGDPPPTQEALLWTAVPAAETSFFTNLLRKKPDVSTGLTRLDSQLKEIFESEPTIRLVDEEETENWFAKRGFVSKIQTKS